MFLGRRWRQFYLATAMALCTGAFTLVAEEPVAIFNQNCSPCHGKDGRARTPIARKLGVKDLTQSRIADDDIERQIRDGRKGPDAKLVMPAFGEKLSSADIKLLIQFVKKFRQ